MLQALRQLFRHREPAALPASQPSESTPPWAVELTEQAVKATRLQARVGLRLDELQARLDAGLDDLRKQIRDQPPAGTAETADWTPLLDAMDLLDGVALTAVQGGQTELAAGLDHVLARLESQAKAGGFVRWRRLGTPPDGRLMRVVAAEVRADLPAGVVSRIVRSPVLRGQVLVREGEVVISAASFPPPDSAFSPRPPRDPDDTP